MTSGAIVANLLEGMKFALGPTMAMRRDALDAVGGFEPLADYCADDYVLGREVAESGRQCGDVAARDRSCGHQSQLWQFHAAPDSLDEEHALLAARRTRRDRR